MVKNGNNKHTLFRIIWILLVIIIACYLYRLYMPYFATPNHLRHFDIVSLEPNPLHRRLKPSGSLGHGLGVIGTVLMVLCVVLYILRKKIEELECLGSLSLWLEIHIFLGILGPVLIVFHSALKIGGLTGIGFWLMVIAVISGIFGRIFFGKCFGNITKRYDLLHKIDVFLERDLKEASINSSVIRRAMGLKSSNFPSDLGIIAAVKEWAYIRREKNNLMVLIDKKYGDRGSEDYEALKKWATEVISRLDEISAVSGLNLNLSILNKWLFIHEASSYLLFILVIFHILVTTYWGYMWIF